MKHGTSLLDQINIFILNFHHPVSPTSPRSQVIVLWGSWRCCNHWVCYDVFLGSLRDTGRVLGVDRTRLNILNDSEHGRVFLPRIFEPQCDWTTIAGLFIQLDHSTEANHVAASSSQNSDRGFSFPEGFVNVLVIYGRVGAPFPGVDVIPFPSVVSLLVTKARQSELRNSTFFLVRKDQNIQRGGTYGCQKSLSFRCNGCLFI